MGTDAYLHDKGTDKLIADVRAFDPTKVNPAEADEVPIAILGQGDTAVAVVGNADGSIESRPYGWVTRHVDMAHDIGFQSGIVAAINAIFADDEIRTSDKARLANALAKIGPAGTTRKG